MELVYSDGGRSEAGYRTKNDCVVVAIAIALRIDYKTARTLSKEAQKRVRKKNRCRVGMTMESCMALIRMLGLKYEPYRRGLVKPKFNADELPQGRLIVDLPKHWVCVENGVAYDRIKSSPELTVCGVVRIPDNYSFNLNEAMK